MKNIKKLLLAFVFMMLSFVFITTVYADDLPTDDATPEEEMHAEGIYVVSVSTTNVKLLVPKNYEINQGFPQRWSDTYNTWVGCGSRDVNNYYSDDQKLVTFNYDFSYTFFRIFLNDIVFYVNTEGIGEQNPNTVYTLEQDTTYTDENGGLRVKWNNRVSGANKYHLILKSGGVIKHETDVDIDEKGYVFPTDFGRMYAVYAYPKYGNADHSFIYEPNEKMIDELSPYLSVNDLKASFENKSYEWSGAELDDEFISFTYKKRDGSEAEINSGRYNLTHSDFKVGGVTATLSGRETEHLLGTREIKYTIKQRDISNDKLNRIVGLTPQAYTGLQIKPEVTLEMRPSESYSWTSSKVKAITSDNYTLKYGYNVGGPGGVVFVGKNNCKSQLAGTFDISDNDAEKTSINNTTVTGVEAKKYSGKPIIQEGLKVKFNDYELLEGIDYSLKYTNNIDAGTAIITITGMGDFDDERTVAFKINPKEIKPNIKLSTSSFVWNNKAQKPTVTVLDDITELPKSQYSLKWASGLKNVGSYKVTVTLKKNYKGSGTATFSIIPKGTSLSSLKSAKKAMTVKWKKLTTSMPGKISGYQIQYSLNDKFTGAKNVKVKGYSKTSTKISKLTSKKTYYVRVRTYSKVSGKTFYSKWSASKTVKVK